MDFLGGSAVKNLPAKQEMRVWFLGQEDPLEKGMSTDSSIIAWEREIHVVLVGYNPWLVKSWTRLSD